MKKTAVVYDKWLSTLGGGEVVACNMARILKDNGYDVIFISGKEISVSQIKEKLGIDLSDIKFEIVWNDEIKLKKIVQNKDLFINCSFMDYSFGYAKKNIYYTLFPTEAYTNLKGKIFNNFILPFASKIIKPIEFVGNEPQPTIKNGRYCFLIENQAKIAYSYLEKNKIYLLKFSLFLEDFYFSLLQKINFHLQNTEIIEKKITIDHHHNVIHFNLKIKPKEQTIFLNLNCPKNNNVYLVNPKLLDLKIPDLLYKLIYEKINQRLRAGIFINILKRLKSYQLILADSLFTQKWIKKYWLRDSQVLYPPVDLLFEKYDISKIKKENWICNIGRFFTLGHGKKQEILIKAFKKFYQQGYKNWQLHLVGGVENEPETLKFVKYLKKEAKGFPIFFHFNAPRKKVEEILLKSKIYWHATGFGENENKNPIKFEHFGIAPIEAISAGCIPVLYDGGGLEEIIQKLNLEPKINLFSNINNLIKNSISIIKKNNKLNKKVFYHISKNFSINAFIKNFLYLLQEYSST